MTSKHVLALDIHTDRIVHIEQVPEGYKGCSCSKCSQPLIAANRRSETRKVAYYFRHKGDSGCGLETALHRYAKELIETRQQITLPAYEKIITKEDRSGRTHEAIFRTEPALTRLENVVAERGVKLGDTNIVPDITCQTDKDDTLYVEIKVTHRTGEKKCEALGRSQKSAIEIDLGPLLQQNYISLEVLDNFILDSAPRHWLSAHCYRDSVEQRKADLARRVERTNRNIEREEKQERARAEQRRRQEQEDRMEWRERFSVVSDLLNDYAPPHYRKALIAQYRKLFDDENSREYALRQTYKDMYGGIPHLVNLPVKHELAFSTHRIVWQSAIMNDVILPAYDTALKAVAERRARLRQLYHVSEKDSEVSLFDLPRFKPISLYGQLLERGIRTCELVRLSEEIARDFIESETYEDRPSSMRYIKSYHYDQLPKPICAIRQYLRVLCDLELFTCDEDQFRANHSTPPRLDMIVPGYHDFVSEGLLQYSI